MRAEKQIVEPLAEVMRKQDQMQGTLQQVLVRLDNVEENQRTHQQILRTLAVNQQNQ